MCGAVLLIEGQVNDWHKPLAIDRCIHFGIATIILYDPNRNCMNQNDCNIQQSVKVRTGENVLDKTGLQFLRTSTFSVVCFKYKLL